MAHLARLGRRRLLSLLAAGAVGPALGRADGVRNFSIATGDPTGTYYLIAGLIAGIITSPPGGDPCRPGEACGVPGLIALVQSTAGSVANLEGLVDRRYDSAFCQSDVAFAAWQGDAPFDPERFRDLRALAALYPEIVQLVVRDGAAEPPRRLAAGLPRSGTLVTAPIVLPAFGLDPAQVELLPLGASRSLEAMGRKEIDGFMTVAGVPTPVVAEAIERYGGRLRSVVPAAAWNVVLERSHLRLATLPPGLYGQPRAAAAVAVPALWLVRADLSADLADALVAAIWDPAVRAVLDEGHPAGRHMTLTTALKGVSVPLHPGAERFYRRAGLLRGTPNGGSLTP